MTPIIPRTRLVLLGAMLPMVMAAPALAQPPPLVASPAQVAQGRAVYVSKGCFQCHGYVGQGALGVAPPLAPLRLPMAAIRAYVRKPSGQMPPYSKTLLSDAEVEAVTAFLGSLPKPHAAADIPMLAPFVAARAAPPVR
jgi:ubiquinol-cytochrome c reductase cytochrome c subunit